MSINKNNNKLLTVYCQPTLSYGTLIESVKDDINPPKETRGSLYPEKIHSSAFLEILTPLEERLLLKKNLVQAFSSLTLSAAV